jgi:site-specific recombinase XerD
LETAATKAKISGVTPHVLRHAFASRLCMAGVDLRTVQELGGWSTLAMVQRYSHLSPEHKAEAVERMLEREPLKESAESRIISLRDSLHARGESS